MFFAIRFSLETCDHMGLSVCMYRNARFGCLYFGYNFVRAGFYDLRLHAILRSAEHFFLLIKKGNAHRTHFSLYAVVKFNFFFFSLFLSLLFFDSAFCRNICEMCVDALNTSAERK